MKGRKSKGEKNHERQWTLQSKLTVLEGRGLGGWVSLVMGIEEGTFRMEHWVLCTNNESRNTISKTNDVMYGE